MIRASLMCSSRKCRVAVYASHQAQLHCALVEGTELKTEGSGLHTF